MNADKERAVDAKVAAWRADWKLFVEEACGVTLDDEQAAILRAVQRDPRVSVASGTARGKDFVAACAAFSFLVLTPRWKPGPDGRPRMSENTKVALTAPTERQVKNIMMPEIARLYEAAARNGVTLPGGRLNSCDIRTENEEWFLVGFKADDNNHEAWSGFHAVHTMFVVTEATGISPGTFAAIEGNLQGDSRLLLVFNPNVSTGYAAATQGPSGARRWKRFRLNSLTAPNVAAGRTVIPGQVDRAWVEDKLEHWCVPIEAHEARSERDDFEFEGRWYSPEDLFRVKVLGKFPKVPEDALIPRQWLEAAHGRWLSRGGKEPPGNAGARVVGVDVAGMGRDCTCFCERRGWWVSHFDARNSGGRADHMAVAGMAMDYLRDPSCRVSVDTIGEGAGVYSRLLELGAGDRAMSCKFSEAARDYDGKPLTDRTGQYRFLNMRAWLFWMVREWLDPSAGSEAALPPDPDLDAEAAEIRWGFRSDGRIYVNPKDEIRKRVGRSTDRFDALAGTFHPFRAGLGLFASVETFDIGGEDP